MNDIIKHNITKLNGSIATTKDMIKEISNSYYDLSKNKNYKYHVNRLVEFKNELKFWRSA